MYDHHLVNHAEWESENPFTPSRPLFSAFLEWTFEIFSSFSACSRYVMKQTSILDIWDSQKFKPQRAVYVGRFLASGISKLPRPIPNQYVIILDPSSERLLSQCAHQLRANAAFQTSLWQRWRKETVIPFLWIRKVRFLHLRQRNRQQLKRIQIQTLTTLTVCVAVMFCPCQYSHPTHAAARCP